MQIETKSAGTVLIVKPTEKRLDARAAVDFKQKMVGFIAEGHQQIALDLAEVDFIDSSGLGAIVSSLKKIGTQGEMVICGVRETVMALFKLTRMDRVFRIHPSEEEAIATLSA